MSLRVSRPVFQVFAAVALCLGMAACAFPGEQSLTLSSPSLSASDAIAHVESAQPIASLPPAAGRTGVVRVSVYPNGLRQDIYLGGGALRTVHNGLTVYARTSDWPTLEQGVPLLKPSSDIIQSEMDTAFPHVLMKIAEREASNRYGPYGLALGHASRNTRCVYMWQWIDESQLPREKSVDGPLSIRVRLCRSGLSLDAMTGLLNQLTIR